MKTKIEKKFVYEGFGFPVELSSVKLVFVNGEWLPKIDIRNLADHVIAKIPLQEEHLSGNQVKFIRDYFSMSLREFAAKVVNVSHMAVSKWEKYGSGTTNMDINIELMLRLYISEQLAKKAEKEKKHFFDIYQSVRALDLTDDKPYIILNDAA
ncbi:MAG: hypothetical protein WCG27_01095 [Pseudomonadota bacterium]